MSKDFLIHNFLINIIFYCLEHHLKNFHTTFIKPTVQHLKRETLVLKKSSSKSYKRHRENATDQSSHVAEPTQLRTARGLTG